MTNRRNGSSGGAAVLLCLGLCAPLPVQGLLLGQVDTFEDLTTDGWFAGGLGLGQVPPTPPAVVADGGPTGNGDAFMVVTAQGGNGPGSRLVAINGQQWAGDYLGAGIGGISMDLRNLGQTALTIRLLFEDPVAAPPIDEGVGTLAISLAAGSGWTHAFLPVSPSALTMLSGDASTLLGNVTLLRIIHSTAADAEPIAGVLGVDNIRAEAARLPEPGSLVLMLTGLLALAWRFRARVPGAQRRQCNR